MNALLWIAWSIYLLTLCFNYVKIAVNWSTYRVTLGPAATTISVIIGLFILVVWFFGAMLW